MGVNMGKIIIADDNQLSRELLKTIVQRSGHTVIEASDGQEVIDIVSREPIDLIFMDCSMPSLTGIEASQQIRKMNSPDKSNIKIIGVSAFGLSKEQECLDAGMNDYVCKPISLSVIREKLKLYFIE